MTDATSETVAGPRQLERHDERLAPSRLGDAPIDPLARMLWSRSCSSTTYAAGSCRLKKQPRADLDQRFAGPWELGSARPGSLPVLDRPTHRAPQAPRPQSLGRASPPLPVSTTQAVPWATQTNPIQLSPWATLRLHGQHRRRVVERILAQLAGAATTLASRARARWAAVRREKSARGSRGSPKGPRKPVIWRG